MHIKRPFENGRSNSKGLFHIYVRVDMGEGLPHIPVSYTHLTLPTT